MRAPTSVSIRLVQNHPIPPYNVFFIDSFGVKMGFFAGAATAQFDAHWPIRIEPCKLYFFPPAEMVLYLRLYHVR